MSDTLDDTPNGTQNRSPVGSSAAGEPNATLALSENLQKTLKEVEFHIHQQMEDARRLKSDPERVLRERENAVAEALAKAKNFYRKKEVSRALEEWEKICPFLDESDGFRKKIRELRAGHESLLKVNQELQEIKKVLTQRSSPPQSEAKFVQEANHAVNSQVKNVYSYLSQQIRMERTPKGISFWWPVFLAAVILVFGFVGLKSYFSATQKQQLSRGASSSELRISALNLDHEEEMQALSRKHAEDSKNDREKIIQLETRLREVESRNSNLEKQSKALFEDNIIKDKTIAALS